ncbi:MAG: DUF551 domain-containing protein [Phocaeicola sp.]|nr:DUF551 domain-containing protein [Phocaeicola sp.]
MRMKQTIEEAAKQGAEGYNIVGQNIYKSGYIAGAEWQSKQLPWISVKERLPEEEQKVFVLTMRYGVPYIQKEKFRRSSNLDTKERWIHGNSIVLAWLPIPSFDEILKNNNKK